jgi:hypothetical protein
MAPLAMEVGASGGEHEAVVLLKANLVSHLAHINTGEAATNVDVLELLAQLLVHERLQVVELSGDVLGHFVQRVGVLLEVKLPELEMATSEVLEAAIQRRSSLCASQLSVTNASTMERRSGAECSTVQAAGECTEAVRTRSARAVIPVSTS